MSIHAVMLSFTLLGAAAATAQTEAPRPAPPPDAMARVQMESQAMGLLNEGKPDEAIALFKELLAAAPADERVQYELGTAYAAQHDFHLCKETLEPLADHAGPRQLPVIGTLAHCLDGLGELDAAIATYRRGLAVAPQDPSLIFNLAVTLAKRGRLDEARTLFESDARVRPSHATTHYLLAQLFEAQGLNVQALFSYLRFLSLEPSSKRATLAATRTQGLLNGQVRKLANGSDFPLAPAAASEGNYGPLRLALTMTLAGAAEGDARASAFEKAQQQLASDVDQFLELSANEHADYTATMQRPFFAELRKEGLIEPFAAVTLSSLHLPGTEEWSKKNMKAIERYAAWIGPRMGDETR